MNFIDFFAGIGGIRLGLEQAGHKCVGFCEWDKFARQSYKAIHNCEGEWENHDIRTVKPYDLPRADLWTFGFPCQDLSIAGKRKGLQEGERSGLFYEIIRLLQGTRQEDRPKWLLAENVKGLLSAGGGFDFLRCVTELGQLGYDIEWQVLNSKNFGVPQNRERVFIVGYLGNGCGRKIFPITPTDGENNIKLQEMTSGMSHGYRVYNPTGLSVTLSSQGGGAGAKTGLYAVGQMNLTTAIVDKPRGIGSVAKCKLRSLGNISAGCIVSTYHKGAFRSGANVVLVKEATKKGYAEASEGDSINLAQPNSRTRRGRVGKSIAGTLTCNNQMAVVHGVRIRKLTPRECWRLQGFPDECFDMAKASGVSETQLYKQAGNTVTVSVARAIGNKLKRMEDNE